jgi:hypothetical protein
MLAVVRLRAIGAVGGMTTWRSKGREVVAGATPRPTPHYAGYGNPSVGAVGTISWNLRMSTTIVPSGSSLRISA